MTIRTSTRIVTFSRPFHLDEIEQELPAGPYSIETEEETLDGLSFIAWRRVATHIMVGRPNGSSLYLIDPLGLEHALEQDAITRETPL